MSRPLTAAELKACLVSLLTGVIMGMAVGILATVIVGGV